MLTRIVFFTSKLKAFSKYLCMHVANVLFLFRFLVLLISLIMLNINERLFQFCGYSNLTLC